MTSVLTAIPDAVHGLVQLVASPVPNGNVVVTRTADRVPTEIRDGDFTSSTGAFVRTDSEVPFGTDLVYTVTDTLTGSRYIQTNLVLNPKAGVNLNNATAGTNRTLTQDTAPSPLPKAATTAFKVGPNSAGVSTGTVADRTLLSFTPAELAAGKTYYLRGQVMYDSPDFWLWQDAKAAGSWQTVENKGTWGAVKGSISTAAGTAYASLYAAVVDGSGNVVVAPFQILGAQQNSANAWLIFKATVTVPAGAPSNCKLVILQGTTVREYAVTWWLTTLLVSRNEEMTAGALSYFDGDSALPANPAANLVPGYDWADASHDASITWSGTPNNSTSVFTGPSRIQAQATVPFGAPDPTVLPVSEPVLLSDPITPQLAQWFTLSSIGDLTYPGRTNEYDVLGKRFRIGATQVRGMETGQLMLVTYTAQQYEIADRLLGTGRIVLLRNPNPDYPETDWYLLIKDVVKGRLPNADARRPERAWTIPFTRVERPVGLINASTLTTWSQVKATYTWDQAWLNATDWLDLSIRTPVVSP